MAQNYENIDEYIADHKAKLERNQECGTTWYNLGVGYLTKREFMDAERAFLAAISNSPTMAEALVQLGGIALQRGDIDGCLNYNIEASKVRPFFAVPWGNIGFCQLQKGETDKALQSLKRALKYDPNFLQALATMGSAFIAIGDYEEAEKKLDKCIELQPNFGPAWNNLALVYIERKDYEKAKDALKKAEESGYEVSPELLQEVEANC